MKVDFALRRILGFTVFVIFCAQVLHSQTDIVYESQERFVADLVDMQNFVGDKSWSGLSPTNIASDVNGGAIAIDLESLNITATFTGNFKFEDNSALSGFGGAVVAKNSSSGNSVLLNFLSAENAPYTEFIFENNSSAANNNGGGAIFARSGTVRSTVNFAVSGEGKISFSDNSAGTPESSGISVGGAVYSYGRAGSSVDMSVDTGLISFVNNCHAPCYLYHFPC